MESINGVNKRRVIRTSFKNDNRRHENSIQTSKIHLEAIVINGLELEFVKVNSSTKRRSAKQHENHDIAIQKLHSLLSPYIVGRIRTLNDFEL